MSEAPSARKTTAPLDLRLSGVLAFVARNRDVYRKTWKTNFLPPLLEPFLYLLSVGYGVGALVGTLGGVPYAAFVAPGILAITVMQSAFFETTYGSFVRLVFQRTWDAVTATPVSLDDVLVGEMVWAATKSALNTGLMAVVIAGFGLLPWFAIPIVVVVGFLGGLIFAGLGLLCSSRVKSIDGFSFAMYLFITPMMLFAGTFFPLAQLPAGAQAVAQALPLTHVVAVLRPLALGDWAAIPALSAAYVAAASFAAPALALWLMKRKLQR
ncbi:MAG: ABC transporter permease [Candidatus Thermoplasmatota archaeon]